jgi:hypothetical protein
MRNLRLFVGLIGLLSSCSAFAAVPGWTISESSGQVSIIAPGVSKVAQRGGAVSVGEVVTTGANGRAVLVRGEEYLIVSPNTRIRVADPARSGGMTQIMELFGNTIFRIKKMATPHFGVQTPYLAAVVKGTTFSVTVTERGASVQVVEGRVEVSTRDGGASYMVLPGDIASVNAGALSQLNVAGRENQVIMSEGPKANAPDMLPEPDDTMTGEMAAEAAETPMMTVIGTAVSEGPVSLEAMSGGMVKGDTAMTAMTATMVSETGAAPKPSENSSAAAEVAETTPPLPLPSTPVKVAINDGSGSPTALPPPTAANGAGSSAMVTETETDEVVISLPPTPNPSSQPSADIQTVLVAPPPAQPAAVTPPTGLTVPLLVFGSLPSSIAVVND